jgi:hypothetical protein
MLSPTPFHHKALAALDRAQMGGAHAAPLHALMRRALRDAQMSGAPFESEEALAAAVYVLARPRRRRVRFLSLVTVR